MRAFVRFFWGIQDRSDRVLKRKERVNGNLNVLLKNPYNEPFYNYVWGEENYKQLIGLGFENVRLVYKEPFQWDLSELQFRHKLEGLRIASEEFDEFVHLDYDALPTKKLPVDFWQTLNKKESFQGNLQQYKRCKCPWRKIDSRKVLNGGAVYIRDKSIADKLIKCWERTKNKRSCEPAMSLYLDDIHKGWIGVEKFRELHELECCNLSRNGIYGIKPDACFIHFAGCGSIGGVITKMGLIKE